MQLVRQDLGYNTFPLSATLQAATGCTDACFCNHASESFNWLPMRDDMSVVRHLCTEKTPEP